MNTELVSNRARRPALFGALFTLIALSLFIPAASAGGAGNLLTRSLFTMTDDPAGNAIIAFNRNTDGSLIEAGRFATGGAGSGTLAIGDDGGVDQNQHSLIRSGRLLFAVNAGANPDEGSISVLRIEPDSLSLVDTASSGGTRPTSLALNGNLLYALNRVSGTVSGFRVATDGELEPIPGSRRALSGGGESIPSQIGFSNDGRFLYAVERQTQTIDAFRVNPFSGRLSQARALPSNGDEPFAFVFDRHNHLLVAEGFKGARFAPGAASSYETTPNGSLQVISGSVQNFGDKTCWIVATGDGSLAFTQAAGGEVSSYAIDDDGSLTLIEALAAQTGLGGKGGLDIALAARDRFLYALNSESGISSFRIGENGALAPLPAQALGLPTSSVGLVGR